MKIMFETILGHITIGMRDLLFIRWKAIIRLCMTKSQTVLSLISPASFIMSVNVSRRQFSFRLGLISNRRVHTKMAYILYRCKNVAFRHNWVLQRHKWPPPEDLHVWWNLDFYKMKCQKPFFCVFSHIVILSLENAQSSDNDDDRLEWLGL